MRQCILGPHSECSLCWAPFWRGGMPQRRQQRALSSAAYSRQWAYGAPGGDSALMGLMIVNGLVFVAWQTLDQRFMSRHFLVRIEGTYVY